MKSKPTTYILLAAVIAIWGFIAWKIIDRKEPEPPEAVSEKPQPVREKNPRDSLWLNYRDPFLGNVQRKEPDFEPEHTTNIPSKPTPDFKVRYYGKIIKNRMENFIVEIDGQQHILRKGDIEDGYRLQAVWDDSLRFYKEGDYFTVPLSL